MPNLILVSREALSTFSHGQNSIIIQPYHCPNSVLWALLIYKEHDPGLAFSGRPALGLQPSLNLSERHCDPNRNRLLFSDPASSRAEFLLGLLTEFLVIVSGTLLPLNSLKEKRSLASLRLGTSQPCTGEITLVHGLVFSGLACPKVSPHPVSNKGGESSSNLNRTGPLNPLSSSQRWDARALAFCPSRCLKVFHSSLFPSPHYLKSSGHGHRKAENTSGACVAPGY